MVSPHGNMIANISLGVTNHEKAIAFAGDIKSVEGHFEQLVSFPNDEQRAVDVAVLSLVLVQSLLVDS
jgi:hypothetical protein